MRTRWCGGGFTIGCGVVLAACGGGSEGTHATGDGASGGQSGSTAQGGGAGTLGQRGGSGGTGAVGGGTSEDCTRARPTEGGALLSVIAPKHFHATDVRANCDGSFAAGGYFYHDAAGAHFYGDAELARSDGTKLVLTSTPMWFGKFDASGFVTWAKGVAIGSSPGNSTGGSIFPVHAVNFQDGSTAFAAAVDDTAVFAKGEPNEATVTVRDLQEIGFVARYTKDGALAWLKTMDPNGTTIVSELDAAPDGSVVGVVRNILDSGITIGAGEIDFHADQNDLTLFSLSADGHFLHAETNSIDTGHENVVLVRTLKDGSVVFVADSLGGAVVAKGTPKETKVPAGFFFAKFTPALEFESVHVIRATGSIDPLNAYAFTTTVLPDGSLTITADFSNPFTLGAGEAHEATFPASNGVQEAVVAHYDPEGHVIWATSVEGAKADVIIHRTTALGDGTVWILGEYQMPFGSTEASSLVIAPGTPEALTLPTLGASEFVARLDVNGKPQWAAPIRDSGRLVSEILAASPASLIVAGDFQETVNVGSPPRTLTTDADTTYFARFGP